MTDELTLLSALIAGLLGGVHCAGMCGGIVSALSLNISDIKNTDLNTDNSKLGQKPSANVQVASKKIQFLVAYNLARITSYSIAGLLMGGVGWWLSNWVFINKAQMILQIIAALFMILLGLYLANWSKVLVYLEKPGNSIWKRIEPLGRRFIPIKKTQDAFLIGLIWGWLPCGLVYSMLIWSMSAGGALQGGLLMLCFGLGTLPNLLLIGVFAQQITRWFQLVLVRSIAGLIIISFALLLLYRVINNF